MTEESPVTVMVAASLPIIELLSISSLRVVTESTV